MKTDVGLVKLLGRAKEMGLTVEFVTKREMDEAVKHVTADACYSHVTGKILMRKSLTRTSRTQLLYTLAHEIGHAIDHIRNRRHHVLYSEAMYLYSSYRYAGIDVENIPSLIGSVIVTLEENAYDRADELLSELGIELDQKEVKRLKETSLGHYVRIFKGCSRRS